MHCPISVPTDIGQCRWLVGPTATASVATDSACKVEALQFLSDPSHELDQLKRYPTVAKAFVKFNTTVPSSAPVERLFSQAGLILTPRRNRLSDEFFETLLLLKKNAKL